MSYILSKSIRRYGPKYNPLVLYPWNPPWKNNPSNFEVQFNKNIYYKVYLLLHIFHSIFLYVFYVKVIHFLLPFSSAVCLISGIISTGCSILMICIFTGCSILMICMSTGCFNNFYLYREFNFNDQYISRVLNCIYLCNYRVFNFIYLYLCYVHVF